MEITDLINKKKAIESEIKLLQRNSADTEAKYMNEMNKIKDNKEKITKEHQSTEETLIDKLNEFYNSENLSDVHRISKIKETIKKRNEGIRLLKSDIGKSIEIYKLLTGQSDFYELSNVKVTANGKLIEEYDLLHISRDIFRGDDGNPLNKKPYGHALFAEEKGLFIPSMALTTTIMAKLLESGDKDAMKILGQYKDYGRGYGWHTTNTLNDWKKGTVETIHYPKSDDFGQYGGQKPANENLTRIALKSQVTKDFMDITIPEALKIPEYKIFVNNFQGDDAEKLIEVAKYFNKIPKMWLPNNPHKYEGKTGAWVGCYINFDYFCIISDSYLDYYDAGRGVRAEGAGAASTGNKG